jgi:hypothetical protein
MKTALLTFLALIKAPLARLFSSMKFMTFLLGVITTQAAKYGFEVDPETYWTITGLFGLLLGAQAATDHGKAKAEIESRNVQSGRFRVGVTLALAGSFIVAAPFALAACGWLKSETKAVASDVVDCTKANAVSAAMEFAPLVDSMLASALSDTGKMDWASVKAATKSFALDTGGCVLAAAIERLKQPRGQDSQASPLAVDLADLEAGWSLLRRTQFEGKMFALGGT